MFTNAGMVPFKDVFTGKDKRPYTRVASCQKCLRISGKHNDLEEVGYTPRHQTLFEMLGNFSFGDYFKEEAIPMAWSLLIDELKMDRDRLWVTVHTSDDEAWEIWAKKVGVPESRIQRLGDKDNFWSMGPVGPCGPCTEIFYDLGPTMGDCLRGPEGGTDRYMEIWNNVFMQFERFADGSMVPLPKPSVDTGAGLERMTSVLQGVTNNYDTDLLRDLMLVGARIAGVPVNASRDVEVALRVLADHSRACAFMVAEGIIPGNEGRGYELRRLARRAIRYGVKLGLGKEPFFYQVAEAVIDRFGEAYPELEERRKFVLEVIRGEEERFAETRDRGLTLLDRELEGQANGATLPGEVVFKLHDTYGFPPDLTRLIAGERGVGVDLEGYERRMEQQRELGRGSWRGSGSAAVGALYHSLVNEGKTSAFVGYHQLQAEARVVALIRDGESVAWLGTGERGEVFVDRSPFYGESGGQVGDQGAITSGPHVHFMVEDTQKPAEGLLGHRGVLQSGPLRVGDAVTLTVDAGRRAGARRNHTATHLLHAALRTVLGDHVAQKGSLVGPDRLRFDFSHFKAVNDAELRQIEDLVYAEVLRNAEVKTDEMDIDTAKRSGAIAMFGEKYGDRVRVVSVPGFSRELCGGTHVSRTGEIGLFRFVSEGAVASGVRRVEAQTGLGALAVVRAGEAAAEKAAGLLRAPVSGLAEAVERLSAENASLRKTIEDAQRKEALAAADQMLARVVKVGDVSVLAAETSVPAASMRDQADKLRDKIQRGVVVLVATEADKVRLLVCVTKDLAGSTLHAGKLIQELAPLVGGKGGGTPEFAQAGGTNPAGVATLLGRVVARVTELRA